MVLTHEQIARIALEADKQDATTVMLNGNSDVVRVTFVYDDATMREIVVSYDGEVE